MLADDAGQRIDNYLGRILKGVPKTRLYQMLRRGEVRINGGRVKQTARVAAGDQVRIPPVHLDPLRPATGSARLADQLERCVLYENDELLVIDKPAGVAVHGGSGVSGAVIETFRAAREQPQMELVHRLDRDTSGCLVIAKQRTALRRLQDDLRAGNVVKQYVALVHGRWQRGKLVIDGAVLQREAVIRKLKDWLRLRVREGLFPLAEKIATKHRLKFDGLLVKSQRTRWASCSAQVVIWAATCFFLPLLLRLVHFMYCGMT